MQPRRAAVLRRGSCQTRVRTRPAEQGGGAACGQPLAPGQSTPFLVTTCRKVRRVPLPWGGLGQARAGAANLPESHSSLSSPRPRAQGLSTVKRPVPGTGCGLYLGMAGVPLTKRVATAQVTARRSSGLVGWRAPPTLRPPGHFSWSLGLSHNLYQALGKASQHPVSKLRPRGLKELVQPPLCGQARDRIQAADHLGHPLLSRRKLEEESAAP